MKKGLYLVLNFLLVLGGCQQNKDKDEKFKIPKPSEQDQEREEQRREADYRSSTGTVSN